MNSMIKKLKNKGKITLIIIDNLNHENKEVNKKIHKLNNLKNVKTKRIQEKDTFKTLDEIISGGVK